MAIAFDSATASATINGPASVSLTHTATGDDRIAVIGIFHNSASTISSVTYDGVAATHTQTNTAGDGNYKNELYYLIAPNTGSVTVTCTFTGAAFGSMAVATFTGAKQSAQPDADNGVNTSTASGVTVSVTTVADNTWMCGFFEANQGTALGVGTNTTSRAQLNDGTFSYSIMITSNSSDQTPAGSFSQISTHGSVPCGGVAMSIAPLVAASGPANLKTVNGLAKASVKTIDGLAIASVKTWNGLT